MPRLWTESITAHRDAVRAAIVEAAAALVAEHGPTAVTMSQVAQAAGVGRATLYKYFPHLDAMLVAWHDGQVSVHLRELADVAASVADPAGRVTAVLRHYAMIMHGRGDHPLAAVLDHRHDGARSRLHDADAQLEQFLSGLLADAAADGQVRTDVGADELAGYCRNALAAAVGLRSDAAVDRLVMIVQAGLRPEAV